MPENKASVKFVITIIFKTRMFYIALHKMIYEVDIFYILVCEGIYLEIIYSKKFKLIQINASKPLQIYLCIFTYQSI